MKAALALLASLGLFGCTPDQEASRYVEAVEIPLDVSTEREELVKLLSAAARVDEGLHVDDTSIAYARYHADIKLLEPELRPTISVTVWRGDDDDDLVAQVSDLGHRGRIWATFLRGENPGQEVKFRKEAVRAIRNKWPETQWLPILPSGGLPNPDHFVLTAEGYKIRRSEAASYDLPPDSEVFAAD
jgi:hypothetical protein